MIRVAPCTLRQARAFVAEHHRHHKPPQGGLWAIALLRDVELVGVAIAGRPVARGLQDGVTLEITRMCVIDGVRNGCSMLYRAVVRAAIAMGYRRVLTYILATESGVSLRAARFEFKDLVSGRSWNAPSRHRRDSHPTVDKQRWEAAL